MNQLKIRNAREKDINKLLLISKNVTNINSRKFLGDLKTDKFLNSAWFKKEVVDNIKNITCLIKKETIIGWCAWEENELKSFLIAVDFQKQGYGSFFLNKMAKLKQKEYDQLILECFEKDLIANKFYLKNGWTSNGSIYDQEVKMKRLRYQLS